MRKKMNEVEDGEMEKRREIKRRTRELEERVEKLRGYRQDRVGSE